MLACLALVFLPTGHWVGLDALLFGQSPARAASRRARPSATGRELAAGRPATVVQRSRSVSTWPGSFLTRE